MLENKKLQAKAAIERFKKRRRLAKWMFAIGITAILIHSSVMGVEFHFEFVTAKDMFFRGLALLGVGIIAVATVLHSMVQNCPACKRSFREHRDFDEGLPVFNSLYSCPFCLTPIDANYNSETT